MKHIEFDDMVEFIYATSADDSFTQKAFEINKHLMVCAECREVYEQLLTTREAIEESCFEMPTEERVVIKVLETIYKKSNTIASVRVMVDGLIEKIKRKQSFIGINVFSLSEISTSNFLSGHCFYHPQAIGVSKSTGDSQENEKMMDVLIDDKYNRISIALDGTLSLRFQKHMCPAGSIVYLVPNGDGEAVCGEAKDYEDGLTRIVFDDIEPGDYTIVI